MKHEHSNWPFLFIFLFVGFMYFSIEVVGAHAERVKQRDLLCEQKGGKVVYLSANEKICIQKSAIIEVAD